jgi:hypothetical protein
MGMFDISPDYHAPSLGVPSSSKANSGVPSWAGGAQPAQPATGGGAAPSFSGPGAAVNTTVASPGIQQGQGTLDYATKALEARYAGDNGAGRAMDLANQKIRDASMGEQTAAAQGRAARGVSGTGVDDLQNRAIQQNEQRTTAGTDADIALASEQAKTGMLSSLIGAGGAQVGAGTAQGNLNLGQSSLAIQQQNIQQQNQLAQDAANRQQEEAILQMLLSPSTV